MRQLFLFSAITLFAVAPSVFAADAAAGKAKSAVCGACHGTDGNKPIDANTPKLAGQHEANAIMGAQAAGLKDQDIDDLAAYFASQTGDIQEIPHH